MTTMTDNSRRVTGGVDTHKDVHVAAVLDELGRELGVESFPARPAGYRQLLGWLGSFGEIDAVGVEGTGSYGAGLSRYLQSVGVRVIEVQRPDRQDRRRYGKSDPTDARSAARAVLAGKETALAKTADGAIESIRLLRVARRSAIKARIQVANQLHALRDTGPEALRRQLDGLDVVHLVAVAARFHRCAVSDPASAARYALRSLARRWQALNDELRDLDARIRHLVEQTAPGLLELNGVGVQSAATLLAAAGDNPDRLKREASFAALCGVSPLDASSGKQQRHRLNRGGDREANAALYIIVISRLRWDRATKTYMARRLAEGKTNKEVIRCLKRYVAREIYNTINDQLAVHTASRPPAIAA